MFADNVVLKSTITLDISLGSPVSGPLANCASTGNVLTIEKYGNPTKAFLTFVFALDTFIAPPLTVNWPRWSFTFTTSTTAVASNCLGILYVVPYL